MVARQQAGAGAPRFWILVVAGVALLAALLWFVPGPWSGALRGWSGDEVGPQVEKILAANEQPGELANVDLDRRGLHIFYRAHGNEPLWIGANGIRPEARQLLDLLKHADRDGLNPADYNVKAIEAAMRDAQVGSAKDPAILEIMLSQAYADYARDLREGRVSGRAIYADRRMAPPPMTTAGVLDDAADASSLKDHLNGLNDLNPIYNGLRTALVKLREQKAAAQVKVPDGPTLKPGDRDPRVPTLRQRLGVPASPTPEVYDVAVVKAVQTFQRGKGLKADGVLGKGTIAYLNAKPDDQEAVLVANMERARWLPADLGEKFLLADTAGFVLRMYQNGKQADIMRVVVGENDKRTPSMVDRMEYIEVNPYWNVPQSILETEIAPAVMANGAGYLASRNMEVVTGYGDDVAVLDPSEVDWSAAAAGSNSFRVRQRPGGNNSLGRIKFMFPNKEDIYFHDTPADHLFAKDLRTFSHGCVRLERPLDLAKWVMNGDTAKVEQALASGETAQISLPKKIPVYIAYFTAWPRGDGTVEYRPDVYGRDRELIARLRASA